ncbi:SDR family oxidoreductase [Vibrio sp. AK197]
MELNNKRILLTGATGGIGQQAAQLLAEQGARLLLVARNQQKLEALIARLSNPDVHTTLSADLTTRAGRCALNQQVEHWQQQGKRLSVIINNAGSNQFQFLSQRSHDTLETELNLNLLTPILLSQMAMQWLERPGLILNVGSTFGAIGYPGYTSYCAAKAGLHRFSEALNRELDGAGINVLYLAPRATDTDLNSAAVQAMNKKLGNHSDSPQVVAQQLVEMLQQEQATRWLGWPEKLLVQINQWFPSLVSNAIHRHQSVIHDCLTETPLSHHHDVEPNASFTSAEKHL